MTDEQGPGEQRSRKRCRGVSKAGGACRMPPLGGRRRRRRSPDGMPVAVALRTVDDVLQLLERAALDTIALDNGCERNRTLATIAGQALRALEVGSFEERLEALEQAAGTRRTA